MTPEQRTTLKCLAVTFLPVIVIAYATGYPMTPGEAMFGLVLFATAAVIGWFVGPSLVRWGNKRKRVPRTADRPSVRQ